VEAMAGYVALGFFALTEVAAFGEFFGAAAVN